MIYGYMRVSTTGQVKGNSLEEQARMLKKNGATVIFQDAYTGTSTERPNFTKLLHIVKEGDTIVITKLDRFARNTSEGLQVIQGLLERNVKVHILNMGQIDSTPTGKLIFTVMLAFAEFERDMIVQRTSEGKEIARMRQDFTEGRPPKYSEDSIEVAQILLEDMSLTEASKITGISRSTLHRMRNRQYNAKKNKRELTEEELLLEKNHQNFELEGVIIIR